MLERRGFEVDTADSAEAALQQLSESLPQVVFMDHLLPGIQGLEAVRQLRIRKHAKDVRIVMYTSQEGELFAEIARVAGADDVFVKTADSRSLDTILGRLDLLPDGASGSTERGVVVPLRSNRHPVAAAESLEDRLAPILERHREKLRQDLLSEFAILERHEEHMRLEAMRRIDEMTERAIGSITQALEQRSGPGDVRRPARRPAALRAAAVIVALGIGLALGAASGVSDGGAVPATGRAEPVAMVAD
jgi:CheY-like chemotaxis protein